MGLSRWARESMIADVGGAHVEPDAALVRAWQAWAGGLAADGDAGPKTLRVLWMRHRPQARVVAERALAASMLWRGCVYSMPGSRGGVGWMADMDSPLAACDCSGFVCHVLGLPKARHLHGFGPLDLGSDGLLAGADHLLLRHDLDEAQPGDIVGWPSIWVNGGRKRAEGGRVGHVEIVLSMADGRIWTIGCASGNRPAVAAADKTALWRRQGAWIMRPSWYSEAR